MAEIIWELDWRPALLHFLFLFFLKKSLLRSRLLHAVGFKRRIAVVAIFWARVLRRLVVEDACFIMKSTLGVVLIRSLACAKCVPGRLQNGSGVALK